MPFNTEHSEHRPRMRFNPGDNLFGCQLTGLLLSEQPWTLQVPLSGKGRNQPHPIL